MKAVRCCEPLLTSALGEDEAAELSAAFKVLADPARLRLLSLIATGLVTREQRGRWACYRVVPERPAVRRDVLRVSADAPAARRGSG